MITQISPTLIDDSPFYHWCLFEPVGRFDLRKVCDGFKRQEADTHNAAEKARAHFCTFGKSEE